jgi:hypothetical protein
MGFFEVASKVLDKIAWIVSLVFDMHEKTT